MLCGKNRKEAVARQDRAEEQHADEQREVPVRERGAGEEAPQQRIERQDQEDDTNAGVARNPEVGRRRSEDR